MDMFNVSWLTGHDHREIDREFDRFLMVGHTNRDIDENRLIYARLDGADLQRYEIPFLTFRRLRRNTTDMDQP